MRCTYEICTDTHQVPIKEAVYLETRSVQFNVALEDDSRHQRRSFAMRLDRCTPHCSNRHEVGVSSGEHPR